jgi:hypothetical protein
VWWLSTSTFSVVYFRVTVVEERSLQVEIDVDTGAHWSDEYKERMQADMDALTSR